MSNDKANHARTAPRILVTGSRDWPDRTAAEEALRTAWIELGRSDAAVLVHGGCPTGADEIADQYWRSVGLPVNVFPADWRQFGKKAGPLRNQEMVDFGADLVLAFPLPHSRGTLDCTNRADTAGLPVRVISPNAGLGRRN